MTDTERNTEIREFILNHYAPAHQWEPKMAEDWAAWAASNGFLYLCYDGQEGPLVGLCILRPISISCDITKLKDTDFDRDGEAILIDLTISTAGKDALKSMMLGGLERINKPLLVFKRLRTKDKIKVYRLRDFANKILGRK